jgi:hypothetical protein
MFVPRDVEGDEEGDTRDGGSDRGLKEIGDGDGEGLSREEREALAADEKPDGDADGEGEGEGGSDEQSGAGAGQEEEHYEVVVDGEPKKVSLKEALEGYIRTETFHQRMNKVNEVATIVQAEDQKNRVIRDQWIKRHTDLESDFTGLIPKEPDWDAEFARDPAGAHALKKQFDGVKAKLDSMRADRAKVEQERAQENARLIAQFAEQGRSKFVADNNLHDKDVLEKEIASMRKTALAQGFTEQEIAEVYDPRMLTILRKASKYDRMMAAKPKAVIPGKGKTLAPGSVNGARRSDRKGIDAAQRKLAASGRIDDAADFFRTIL